MDAQALQDRINRGLGTAARAIGNPCDAYRARDASQPDRAANRFLRIDAAFNAQDSRFARAGLAGNPIWYGVFDSAYLQPGDYLVERRGSGRSWFVAALQPLLPALCVLCNRVVSLSRPAAPDRAGVNPYGGGGAMTPLMTQFPASMIQDGSARAGIVLPADPHLSDFQVLLPRIAGVALRRGDLLSDDLGRTAVVAGAELNELGWRLDLRQAAS